MPLDSGTRLGPYTIESPIGAGGMGEVYKARDTRLDRTVAIKVLPAHIAADPDARERFEREARAVAALNHPHICTLHDIGRAPRSGVGHGAPTADDGFTDFLVLEHLEGQSLAQRLEHGPLPLDQALQVAIDIADALATAHRHGIVHRDLKPGNVMLLKSGAKLLDFGLAKVGPTEQAQAVGATAAPTQASLTQAGAILGTFQYMAPEQLEGKDADARTDLFAFGVMLYEMITGRRAFEAESQASLIGAIMTAQPAPVSDLQPVSSPALQRLVTTCLEKDPDERWQSAGDLKRELTWIAGGDGADPDVAVPSVVSGPAWPRALPWGVTAVAVVAAIGLWSVRPSSDVGLTHVSVGMQPSARLAGQSQFMTGRTAFALTADGRTLFFVGEAEGEVPVRLYRRDLAQSVGVPVEGTEGGYLPFLSPDEQWLGFYVGDRLMKAPVGGGPPVEISRVARRPSGVHWTPEGVIVFDQSEGLFQVTADGGVPEALTEADATQDEFRHTLPRMLPGGDAVLFTMQRSLFRWDNAQVVVQSLTTGERTVIVENGADARYVDSGHVVFVRSGTLMAVPFNLEGLEATGGAVALIEGVTQSTNVISSEFDTGAAQYDMSDRGDLVYLPGGIAPDRTNRVVWVDQEGAEEPVLEEPGAYLSVRMSPDGQRMAYTTLGTDAGVWVHDVRRGGTIRLAEGTSIAAIWSPDGRHVTFDWTEFEAPNLFWRLADGSQPAERLTTRDDVEVPSTWSADGQALIFTTGDALEVLKMGERVSEPLIDEDAVLHAELSPDGRWLAYAAVDTGRFEVYVQPYPGAGGRVQVSTRGGWSPVWSNNGRELLYIEFRQDQNSEPHMMRVDFATEPILEPGRPEAVMEWVYGDSRPVRNYDVSPDGQRFLVSVAEEQVPQPRGHLRLIVNWTEELKRRVPGG
jgi:serine/threonine-protein kinase